MVEIKVFGNPDQRYLDALERYASELEIKTPQIQIAFAQDSKQLSAFMREFADFDSSFELDDKAILHKLGAHVYSIPKILRRKGSVPTILVGPKKEFEAKGIETGTETEDMLHELWHLKDEEYGWHDLLEAARRKAGVFVVTYHETLLGNLIFHYMNELFAFDIGARSGYESLVLKNAKSVLKNSLVIYQEELRSWKDSVLNSFGNAIQCSFTATLPPSLANREHVEQTELIPIAMNVYSYFHPEVKGKFDYLWRTTHGIVTPPTKENLYESYKLIFELYYSLPI